MFLCFARLPRLFYLLPRMARMPRTSASLARILYSLGSLRSKVTVFYKLWYARRQASERYGTRKAFKCVTGKLLTLVI